MNTNKLKRFAQEARKKLLEQVASRLELVLSTDSAELREKAVAVGKLREAINATSKEQVIDKVAYTWFNRLMALRFMDANDYQPLGVRVVTPKDGFILPEILEDTTQGQIPDELPVRRQHLFDLLDGKVPSANAQNEVYKELLIGACNHLHRIFPFLFEKINDYTELLLLDDLTSEFSIIQDFLEGMQKEDCQEVEVIGWLYQFYISELNEELISSKSQYKKEDLAPASQLFTPKWVVQYMVDNTLGQLWTELNPKTKVTEILNFYIKPANKEQLHKKEVKSIEEIKFFEPCVGSGHILSYAFDVFYSMYEEQGYNPSEIPELILSKNLFGVDIDERAAQLASFVLLMKGRQKYSRFLRSVERNSIQPNIAFFKDFEFDEKFSNGSILGSLINIEPEEALAYQVQENSLFNERQRELKKLYLLLGQRYDIVVTNPPYIGSSRMEPRLKAYVDRTYPETKSDLFATYILRSLELCNSQGLTGYMTPFVWMFISSYEELRHEIIENHTINNLVQLEYSGFDGATVPVCTFTLRNNKLDFAKGTFIRLSDFKGSRIQGIKTLEAIKNPDCGWCYIYTQENFDRIRGKRLGYWFNEIQLNSLEKDKTIEHLGQTRRGLQSGKSEKFIREWFECNFNTFMPPSNYLIEDKIDYKWVVLNSGGNFRRWYGNLNTVVNWGNNGQEIKDTGKAIIPSEHLYFKEAIVWNKITSGKLGFRWQSAGIIPGDASPGFFPNEGTEAKYILGFLNSKVVVPFLSLFAPTLNAQVGDIKMIPLKNEKVSKITAIVNELIGLSRSEWDSKETSWGFTHNPILKNKDQHIENNVKIYIQLLEKTFFKFKDKEEELNGNFIQTYRLENEITPEVPLRDISILKEETSIENGRLEFNKKEILNQFLSYAVGCMFGRYSLEKEGLVLANLGESLEDYLGKLGKNESEVSFLPDEDNVVPVLNDEWFEDDIVGRFYEFLKASFGKENFEKNLAFVEECLGKDVRKYFVKDFYKDHTKRYKKRPIYWMFSSPKGSFNVLIYMHRYTPDTLNKILNNYLLEYREKLRSRVEHLNHIIETGSSVEQTKATKEQDKLKMVLLELQEYEREILYPLATERIAIDLDDGVLVNYNKFGKAVQEVPGLNDKKTKKKVRGFDWIDITQII